MRNPHYPRNTATTGRTFLCYRLSCATMADEMSVDVLESAVDTVDEGLSWLGLPPVEPLVERLSPANAAETIGLPTPADVGDDLKDQFDRAVNFRRDESRR